MKLPFCAVCGNTADLEQHHFVPKSLGGSDDETNKITLCNICHAIWHRLASRAGISTLVKIGLDKAKANGVKLGRPLSLSTDQVVQAKAMRDSGRMSMTKIAKHLGVSRPTLYHALEHI